MNFTNLNGPVIGGVVGSLFLVPNMAKARGRSEMAWRLGSMLSCILSPLLVLLFVLPFPNAFAGKKELVDKLIDIFAIVGPFLCILALWILGPAQSANEAFDKQGSLTNRRRGQLYRFLVATTILACCAGVLLYRFRTAGEQGRKKTQERFSRMAASLTKIAEQAANGTMPKFDISGDPELDAIYSVFNAYFEKVSGIMNQVEIKLGALDQKDVFDLSMLASKPGIESEIKKRNAAKGIIEQHRRGVPIILQETRTRLLELSKPHGNEFAAPLADAVGRFGQNADGLAMIERVEESHLDFLRFMLGAFDDFVVAGGTISFKTPSNSKKHNELSSAIQNVLKEVEAAEAGVQNRVKSSADQIRNLAK